MAKQCGSYLCQEAGCETILGRLDHETVWRVAECLVATHGPNTRQIVADMAAIKLFTDNEPDNGDMTCIARVVDQLGDRAALDTLSTWVRQF